MVQRQLFVIIGITGNQGGSVARTFLNDPALQSRYRLRGLSRTPSSPASQELAGQGVEMMQAELHDPASLARAFEGANVIFSMTDFWAPFFDPSNHAKAQEAGKSIGELAYELEYEQGRNIADAAANCPSLERFVVSMLVSPKKWSKGHLSKLWHYESKADMMTYIESNYPQLHAKYSGLDLGIFYQSWKWFVPIIAPQKGGHGVFVLRRPGNGEKPVPMVNPRTDTGPYVRALLQKEPGVHLCVGTYLGSWKEWLELWGKIKNKPVRYEVVSIEHYEETLSKAGLPPTFGTEIGEMFQWMNDYGHDGGDPDVTRREDLGIEIPGLNYVEDYIRDEDWSSIGA
ncbi:NmrA-like family domain-containing protein 1 [Fulvia fulva]|uniref:NmrA-like family domain-containing protein 1 n=1 Tax=Passalora fulva TaxID=5499 RepID=A0A9Q8LBP6_PASFU|nr:NmrA-like family domain-containing protein 1 [Fulvia fulva]KAK4631798.1 NmrA-like family domain-containing protein 1 [Fulvia fulva]KAK4632742.1 NmrA-like family domain-containing protein 1 [Fulvia fulva]UJO14525.1 NmrA-like family domain-containing protein 1 [Fulvia fulva]WPV11806.1 NmrA-like family domain-containing protein 1 [Fulvia fulva]WPV26563.1 NmrA-like family domain-containing protein 1 [Fulvia fulva]